MTTLTQTTERSELLVEALPYIREHHGSTVLIKIGGAALDDPQARANVADDIALLALVGIRVVVVHGGGVQISTEMTRRGLEPRFVSGLRVTDDAALEVVSQVLLGQVNPGLVLVLRNAGAKPIGMSGIDGGVITARRCRGPGGEMIGAVGAVDHVRKETIEELLARGFTPVIASLTASLEGDLLNVNADDAAAALAAALSADKLVYLSDVPGLFADVTDADSLISEISCEELTALLPTLSHGMAPKVRSATSALANGVAKVHLLDGRIPHALLVELFTNEGIGTLVTP